MFRLLGEKKCQFINEFIQFIIKDTGWRSKVECKCGDGESTLIVTFEDDSKILLLFTMKVMPDNSGSIFYVEYNKSGIDGSVRPGYQVLTDNELTEMLSDPFGLVFGIIPMITSSISEEELVRCINTYKQKLIGDFFKLDKE